MNILEVAMIKKNVLIGIAEHHYKTSARAPGRVGSFGRHSGRSKVEVRRH